ncbi:transposase [Streptomyces sp. NPDC058620]|uniref:transposase n=1 Tax=Streptomyces sp. NPDC058620 TaxID=3346560 RepID=UPI003663FCA7
MVQENGVPVGMKHYPAEFKADAVALYRSGPGATIRSVAGDLGVNTETLRNWIRAADGRRPGAHSSSGPLRRPATVFRQSSPRPGRGSASWRKSATSCARRPGVSRRGRAGEPLPVR